MVEKTMTDYSIKRYFGFDYFLNGQKEVIGKIERLRDALDKLYKFSLHPQERLFLNATHLG